jgi:AcrR family transcriptional regulator
MSSPIIEIISNFEIKIGVLNAMTELMAETPFDKLTIGSICKAASMSRTTFYRYFDDKFAVAQWYVRYAFSQGTDEIGRTLPWYEGYYITETLMTDQIDFFKGVSISSDYNAIDNYSPRKRRETLQETIVEIKHLKLTEQLRFQIDVVVEAETHLFPRWHEGAYDCSLEEICRWMADSVPYELRNMLSIPTFPRKSGFARLR